MILFILGIVVGVLGILLGSGLYFRITDHK